MAHLWKMGANHGWAPEPLTGEHVTLAMDLRDRRGRHDDPPPGARSVTLVRVTGTNNEVWVLVAGVDANVRVNGDAIDCGIRLLCDRDELFVNGTRSYFSSERLAAVVPLPALEPAPVCPRCRQVIERDASAVQCPQCQVWHHQSEALPCWTYADTCAVCAQPTDLQAGYRWTPEDDAL